MKLYADIFALLRTVEVSNEQECIEIILSQLEKRLPIYMSSMERLLVHADAITLATLPTRVLLTCYITRVAEDDIAQFLKNK